jgi:hypothetical protein
MVFKRIIVVLTSVCFCVYLQGCYSKRLIPRHELEEHPDYRIMTVITVDGEVIEFETGDVIRAVVKDNQIEGLSKDGSYKWIPLSKVRMVYVRKFNPVSTALLVIGISALGFVTAVIIALATKESCPFVYSFDGEQYVFDGEPYGGAICKGLQRTDLCRLEHLRPVEGQYQLRLTNEVNETQYTDEFKLWVVDHPAGVDVIPDADAHLYTVGSLEKPLLAVDSRGEDWYHWLSGKDLLFWESDLLSKDPNEASDLRDTLFLAFPKPPDVQQAKLVVNGCNTLWGSQMLRRMAELRGGLVRQWYEAYRIPERQQQLQAWLDREEIYQLQIYVWAKGTWVRKGEIIGGGPFIAEERVVPLDLQGVEGDTLRIRLAPPAGFWQLNSFAVDYSRDVALELQEISATSMIGHDGADLRATLGASDGDYYVMPEVGQVAHLTFSVPPRQPGLERTIFAKVSGYYDMHLDTSGQYQSDTIDRIAFEPGYVVRFALQEYFKWRSEQLAKSEE